MTGSLVDYDSIAEIYDLYVRADYDVSFFLEEAARSIGSVLELTAGTGRLSLPLLESGVRLTCVDISQGMLDVLSRKLAERGLHADIHCIDVCRLSLPPQFGLAILPFQSFMEIVGEQRQREALEAVRACLVSDGKLICTLHNPAVRRATVDGILRLVGRFPCPEGTLVVSGFEQGGSPVVRRLQFFEFFDPDGGLLRKQLLPMEFTFIEKQDFRVMAEAAGFRVARLYGDYDRSPFDPSRSPFMIWVLENRAA